MTTTVSEDLAKAGINPYQVTAYKTEGDLFGKHENQRVLGTLATVTVERLEDGDERCADIFGCALRRGDVVAHISGKDKYGEWLDHTEEVGELCLANYVYDGQDHIYAEFLPEGSQRCITWLTGCAYVMSLRGLRALPIWGEEGGPLKSADILREIGRRVAKRREYGGEDDYLDNQHRRAVRVLCDAGKELGLLTGNPRSGWRIAGE